MNENFKEYLRQNKLFVIIWLTIFAILIFALSQMLWTNNNIEHKLDEYTCEEIENGLQTGDCIRTYTGKAYLFIWQINSHSCYTMNELYVNYKFRCEIITTNQP